MPASRGWRTLTPASLRAARPSEVSRRASAICASRSRSMEDSSAGSQSARCTDCVSSAPLSAPPHGVGHEGTERGEEERDAS